MEHKLRRLFVGISIPEDEALLISNQLKDIPGKKVPFQNWHLTLHFFGNIEEDKIPLIHDKLSSLEWGNSYTLIFDHIGSFPKPKKAHTLWVGISQGRKETTTLVERIHTALRPLDLPIDPRPFLPHLTVRRFSKAQDLSQQIMGFAIEPTTVYVDRIVLYESILAQDFPRYEELYSYPLPLGDPIS